MVVRLIKFHFHVFFYTLFVFCLEVVEFRNLDLYYRRRNNRISLFFFFFFVHFIKIKWFFRNNIIFLVQSMKVYNVIDQFRHLKVLQLKTTPRLILGSSRKNFFFFIIIQILLRLLCNLTRIEHCGTFHRWINSFSPKMSLSAHTRALNNRNTLRGQLIITFDNCFPRDRVQSTVDACAIMKCTHARLNSFSHIVANRIYGRFVSRTHAQ